MGAANRSKRKSLNFRTATTISLFLSNAFVLCYSFVILAPRLPSGSGAEGLASVVSLAPPAAQAALRPDNHSYVAMCLRIKADPALREWVLYHHLIGVDKFYVFDDGSDPPLAGAIQDLIDAGLVEYNYVLLPLTVHGSTEQDAVYNTCLERYGAHHTFMGFTDVDEFIILRPPHTSLPALLREQYASFDGLVLYYQDFGSSGHTMRPAEGVLASYTRCTGARGEPWVKTLARTSRCLHTAYVHECAYKGGGYAVDVWKNKYEGPTKQVVDASRIPQEPIILHHYKIRSLEDFLLKHKQGAGGGLHPPRPKTMFLELDAASNQTCPEGLAWARRLREAYGELLAGPGPRPRPAAAVQ